MSTSSSNSCCYFGNSFTEAADVLSLQNGADDRYQRHSTSSAHPLTISSSPAPLPSRLTRRRCESRAFSSSFVVVLVSATSAVLCWNLGVSDAFPTTFYYYGPPKYQRTAVSSFDSSCSKKRNPYATAIYMDNERHSSSFTSTSQPATASIFSNPNKNPTILGQSSSSAFLHHTAAAVNTRKNYFDAFVTEETLHYVQKDTMTTDITSSAEVEYTTTTAAPSTALMVDSQSPTAWSDQLISLGSNADIETNFKELIASTSTTKIRASVKETGVESMSIYLKTMGNHELLQADEEIILGREIQKLCKYEDIRMNLEYELLRPPTYAEWAGRIHPNMTVQSLKRQIRRSQRAKAALTESNLRLVISIARRYVNRGLNFQDLCQEGIFGLTKACEKFDPELGFRFSTYSTWWIKQGIMRAIADQGRTIRLPVHIHDQLNTIRRTEIELRDELGRAPTSNDIAETLGITSQRVEFIKKKAATSVSMEAPLTNGGGVGAKGSKAGGGAATDRETTVQDMVGDPAQRPMDEAFNQMFRDDMSRLISTLNSREQAVVRMRFGLDDGKAKTLEEIGKRFSVTRERIRQIEARALHKLRQPYRNYSVKCYVNDL